MRLLRVQLVGFALLGCSGGQEDAVATNVLPNADASAEAGSDGPLDSEHTDGVNETSPQDVTSDVAPGCGPWTCPGCCRGEDCLDGTEDDACGSTGVACVDCTSQGSMCALMACLNCTPNCDGKLCGDGDGCGGACAAGSGCCTPVCSGKHCGQGDGCGATCVAGSGCCEGQCSGKLCGADDGCGAPCVSGSGCCTPSCAGRDCGESDGCFDFCDGPCPGWEHCSNQECVCGPSPNYEMVSGTCLPSCGILLSNMGQPDAHQGCCSGGCKAGTFAAGPGETHDCNYCCSSAAGAGTSCL